MNAKWKTEITEFTLIDGKVVNPVCVWELNEDGEEEEMVCECYEGEFKDRLARARLIAAAPELLEALQNLVMFPLGDFQTEAARAAIAKALGDEK